MFLLLKLLSIRENTGMFFNGLRSYCHRKPYHFRWFGCAGALNGSWIIGHMKWPNFVPGFWIHLRYAAYRYGEAVGGRGGLCGPAELDPHIHTSTHTRQCLSDLMLPTRGRVCLGPYHC